MSLSRNELIYLMAYADGEVDADEIPDVEALIAKSDEAKQVLAQQAALRQWVVTRSEERATAAGADLIADAVMKSVVDLGGGEVIALERARAKRALGRQRFKEFGALAAIAAAVALFMFWPNADDKGAVAVKAPASPVVTPPTAESASPVIASPPASSSAEALAAAEGETPPGIDIQAVESPEHQFSIFYVPAGTGANAHASSVVVWIGEE